MKIWLDDIRPKRLSVLPTTKRYLALYGISILRTLSDAQIWRRH